MVRQSYGSSTAESVDFFNCEYARTSLQRFTEVGRPSVPVSAGDIPLSISSESRGRLYFEDLLDMVVGKKEVG